MNVQGSFNGEMNDVESQLLQQFSCMSTSSKDDLIKEFQRLLSPNQLSSEGCAFFLDMNNWNLQQAICSYFDYDAHKMMSTRSLPSMTFISDVTIGDGEEVPPSTHFVKTWRILNSGSIFGFFSRIECSAICKSHEIDLYKFFHQQATKGGHRDVFCALLPVIRWVRVNE